MPETGSLIGRRAPIIKEKLYYNFFILSLGLGVLHNTNEWWRVKALLGLIFPKYFYKWCFLKSPWKRAEWGRWGEDKQNFYHQLWSTGKCKQCQPQVEKASATLQTDKFTFNRRNSLNSWHPDGPSRWSLLEDTKKKIQKSLAYCSRKNLLSAPLEAAGLTFHI